MFLTPTSRVSIHISLGVIFWAREEIFTALDLVRLTSLNSCLFDYRMSWAICSIFARLSSGSVFMKECYSLLFCPVFSCCLLRIAGILGYRISLLTTWVIASYQVGRRVGSRSPSYFFSCHCLNFISWLLVARIC